MIIERKYNFILLIIAVVLNLLFVFSLKKTVSFIRKTVDLSILNPEQYLRLQLQLIEMIIYRYLYKLIWHLRLIAGCISTTSSFNNLSYTHFEIYRILKSRGSIFRERIRQVYNSNINA